MSSANTSLSSEKHQNPLAGRNLLPEISWKSFVHLSIFASVALHLSNLLPMLTQTLWYWGLLALSAYIICLYFSRVLLDVLVILRLDLLFWMWTFQWRHITAWCSSVILLVNPAKTLLHPANEQTNKPTKTPLTSSPFTGGGSWPAGSGSVNLIPCLTLLCYGLCHPQNAVSRLLGI